MEFKTVGAALYDALAGEMVEVELTSFGMTALGKPRWLREREQLHARNNGKQARKRAREALDELEAITRVEGAMIPAAGERARAETRKPRKSKRRTKP